MNRKISLAAAVLLATGAAASAQSLTTLFDGGNSFAGNMFDLKAIAPGGLLVTGFDINIDNPGVPVNISIYWREGTYVGNSQSMAGWNHLGTASVMSAGPNTPTNVDLGGLELAQNATIGMYVFVTDYTMNPPPAGVPSMNYTNIPPALTFYSSPELELTGGIGKGSPPFTGSDFANRMFNGRITYVPGDPTATGACCFGTGSCQILTGSNCFSQGGTYRGPNTDCATANCPQPAACCFNDGTCDVILETACDAQGGTFNASAATCAAAECPQPGACCVPAGCVVMLPAACNAASGEFRGPGTECATANCPPATQVKMPLPPFNNTFASASLTRGMWFTAPADFVITGLRVPDESGHGLQNVEVVRLNAIPPLFAANTNDFVSLARHIGVPSSEIIAVNIPVSTGDIIGVLGACGDANTMRNSYSTTLPFNSDILGHPVPLERFIMQHNLVTTPATQVSRVASGASRVEVYYSSGTAPCYANCDNSTTEPILNVDDFTCFINEFAAAQGLPHEQQVTHYANCDGSTTAPVLNVDDFTCFINAFAQGCS